MVLAHRLQVSLNVTEYLCLTRKNWSQVPTKADAAEGIYSILMSQQVRKLNQRNLVEEKESVIFEEKEEEPLKETIMNLPTEGIVKAEGLIGTISY